KTNGYRRAYSPLRYARKSLKVSKSTYLVDPSVRISSFKGSAVSARAAPLVFGYPPAAIVKIFGTAKLADISRAARLGRPVEYAWNQLSPRPPRSGQASAHNTAEPCPFIDIWGSLACAVFRETGRGQTTTAIWNPCRRGVISLTAGACEHVQKSRPGSSTTLALSRESPRFA